MKKQALAMALLFASAGALAQDHQPMPVMSSPEQASQDAAPSLNRGATVAAFSTAYRRAGEPAIAIFWNRAFDDQLSQWQANYRRSITGEISASESEIFERQGGEGENYETGQSTTDIQSSGEAQGSYERIGQGEGRIIGSTYHERRRRQQRSGMGEAVEFEFSAGFLQPFLDNRVKVLDRPAIMRLVERDNARWAGSEMIADYQKVETDALLGYADYVGEILFTPDSDSDLGMSFLVSLKELRTGRVVARFKSRAEVTRDKTVKKPVYVATSSGFVKAKEFVSTTPPLQVGEQLAYETMQALTRVWRNF